MSDTPLRMNENGTSNDLVSLKRVTCELERMKRRKSKAYHPFPPACYEYMRSLPGNDRCIDCGSSNPDWAAVSHGALICMKCCGRHRSLGVNYSKVRSLTMDHWSIDEILKMLEGGNDQLNSFFERHALSVYGENASDNLDRRYRTKAARFYRWGIEEHISQIMNGPPYQGREAARQKQPSIQKFQ